MKFVYVVLFGVCCAFGVSMSTMTAEEEERLTTDIELDEFDFEDMCEGNRIPRKDFNSIEAMTTTESYAQAQRKKAKEFSARLKDDSPTREPETTRKLELLSQPGDVLLPPEKYQELLGFVDEVSGVIADKRKECGSKCSSSSTDPDQLLSAWTTQSVAGSDAVANKYPRILDLVSEAAHENGFPDAESYWLTLSDLDQNGYNDAQRLWEEVKPLYLKLRNLVATKLQKKFGKTVIPDTSEPIPLHLLDSYLGNDWTNIIDIVLNSSCVNTFHNIEKKMEEKNLKGKQLYRKAETLTGYLHLAKLPERFWKESEFNQTCPAKTVNPCQSGVRVATCSNASWSNYLDAHRIVMESAYSEIIVNSPLSFILKSGNRYSAIYNAVSGLAEILASSRHYMAQYELSTPTDVCVLQTVLTLSALRLLPAMPYYLVADLARLQAIKTNNTDNIGVIWQKLQSDIQGIKTPGQEWWGFLADPQITFNRPQIHKFYAIFLQLHLFEELMTDNEESFSDAEELIHNKEEFKSLLISGVSKKWPKLLDDVFSIKKIASAPVLKFFSQFESTFFSKSSKVPTAKPGNNAKSATTNPTRQKVTNLLISYADDNNHTLSTNEIETESVADKNNSEDGFGLSSYLLISFFVLVVVIISVVVAVILWRKSRKIYEPPSHQSDPV